jgi:hypothetical protein
VPLIQRRESAFRVVQHLQEHVSQVISLRGLDDVAQAVDAPPKFQDAVLILCG